METHEEKNKIRMIRFWLGLFIAGLILSGLTAFPLQSEVSTFVKFLTNIGFNESSQLMHWMGRVHAALADVNQRYPFLAYGTDWLAFAHLVIAVAFIGPWRDPVRNKWVIDFGLIACVAVIPLALIAGQARGIPWWWRAIDCSFGVFGAIPLIVVRSLIVRLEGKD